MPSSDIVPGRSCENCTLCCKVLAIPALAKPRGAVCTHCAWNEGCTVYAARPAACRDFDCSYLLSPALGDEWKPITAHMVLGYMAAADVILIYTDPDHAGMWRTEPYYSRIKTWAAGTDTGYVLIWEKDGARALVGRDEFFLGQVRDDQVIVRDEQPAPGGQRVTIYAVDQTAVNATR
jgi:hypothetical protein